MGSGRRATRPLPPPRSRTTGGPTTHTPRHYARSPHGEQNRRHRPRPPRRARLPKPASRLLTRPTPTRRRRHKGIEARCTTRGMGSRIIVTGRHTPSKAGAQARCLFVAAYFFSAWRLQLGRCFFGFFAHSLSTLVSFWASVDTLVLGLSTDGSPDGVAAAITGKAPGRSEATSPAGMDDDKGSVPCSGGEVGWLDVVNV